MKKKIVLALFALFLILQLVPYGRDHSNPPVTGEPAWPSESVRALAKRTCFDCHSHETRWPWYAHIAPMSWLVQRDVDEARAHLNFSRWDVAQRHADDAADELSSSEMPPWFYLPLHGEARLNAEEKATLVAGLGQIGGRSKTGAVQSGN